MADFTDVISKAMTLEKIDIRRELECRPSHSRDSGAEHRALAELAQTIAEQPGDVLQKLVDIALELCHAGSAGVSLLQSLNQEQVFRWEAVSGLFAALGHRTMPRSASPCGTTIDDNCTQLMRLPERYYPELKRYPTIYEALLIPFHLDTQPIGTLWIVSHDAERKFDAEDERIIRVLASFAAGAWQLWKARTAAESLSEELTVANESLMTRVTISENEKQSVSRNLSALKAEVALTKSLLLKKVAALGEEVEKGLDSGKST